MTRKNPAARSPIPRRALEILASLAILSGLSLEQEAQGQEASPTSTVAHPEHHPYVDPAGGRERYTLAKERVNEARVYDFYQRQADYYMAKAPSEVPDLLPAYPGLDAGLHGHWGKHNQNQHEDGRWNAMDPGSLITQVFRSGKELTVLKGLSVRLSEDLAVCFDPQSLRYRAVWEGGFIRFHPFRWGTSRNAAPDGEPWFLDAQPSDDPSALRYAGLYRFHDRVIFHYHWKGVETLDSPGVSKSGAFRRSLQFPQGGEDVHLPAGIGGHVRLASQRGLDARIEREGERHRLHVVTAAPGATVSLLYFPDPEQDDGAQPPLEDLEAWTQGGPVHWTETVTLQGQLGDERPDSAYVVDTLTVPYDNPYHSVMQLTGMAFDERGTAFVTTLAGEVWAVHGIDASLDRLTWKRFASGFNQPMGIRIDPDGMFVLDRGQITRLHDLNGNGEADYYENYANDFGGYDRSHSHTFGLHRTADGAFHFTQRESILRTGPDQRTEFVASGVRNCMGIGGSETFFWVGPQEGTWTPATSIIEVRPREFYGLPNANATLGTSIASALAYIPRGIDNSIGGMVQITSQQWGPFQGKHVGLSYGSGTYYLILRDASGARPQGAVVPLEGEFLAGAMRGAFHPLDGQLYVAGLDGWGDYSVKDGCLHRVRYLRRPVYHPSGFEVYSNGILVEFPIALDTSQVEPSAVFAQAWNYQYAKRYGSPEFSSRHAEVLGHDRIPVRSLQLSEDRQRLFVEMPSLEPVMQLHLRFHLVSKDGKPFKTDLFASPMYFHRAFEGSGILPPSPDKPTAISLPVDLPSEPLPTTSGEALEGARPLKVVAAGGLRYEPVALRARAGEPLALTLTNEDVMPHNLVIVAPGQERTVGMASFSMLNDPDAGKKHYVPDLDEVLFHIPVIDAGKEHTLTFRAPSQPGRYPYICTFPGHWQAMRGQLIIE